MDDLEEAGWKKAKPKKSKDITQVSFFCCRLSAKMDTKASAKKK